MRKKYDREFKIKAIRFYEILLKEGEIEVIKGENITSVRELVKVLGISSQTLYKWVKLIEESGL